MGEPVSVDFGVKGLMVGIRDGISSSLDLAGFAYTDRAESVSKVETVERLVRRIARAVDCQQVASEQAAASGWLAVMREQSSVPREVLTREEAMEYLRISDDKLNELTNPRGPIPVRREGKRVYYWFEHLRAYAMGELGARR